MPPPKSVKIGVMQIGGVALAGPVDMITNSEIKKRSAYRIPSPHRNDAASDALALVESMAPARKGGGVLFLHRYSNATPSGSFASALSMAPRFARKYSIRGADSLARDRKRISGRA
jgi:hypothetical protein